MIEPDDPGLWPPATKQRSPVDALRAEFEFEKQVRRDKRAMDVVYVNDQIDAVLAEVARERRSVNRRLGKRDVAIGFVVYLLILTWIGSVVHACRPHPAAPVPVPVEVESK